MDLGYPDEQELTPEAVPYQNCALKQDLARLQSAWSRCRSTRERSAIYKFLGAVFSLVDVWGAAQQEQRCASLALRLTGLDELPREEPYGAVLRCITDIDRKTKSKWSRVLRYAHEHKLRSESIQKFVTSRGGINKCAEKYARRLGRHRPRPRMQLGAEKRRT